MDRMLSRQELTAKLGLDPAQWAFFGQCYEADTENPRACAVTEQPARICFTIKPKSGKGRLTISAEAIPQFERWNPDLYVRLKAGLNFLQLRTLAVQRDRTAADKRKRVLAAQQAHSAVRARARQAVHRHRASSNDRRIPESLQALQLLMQTPGLYFDDEDSRALALEQKTAEIEKALTEATGTLVPDEPVPAPVMAAAAEPVQQPLVPTFDIPEIDF